MSTSTPAYDAAVRSAKDAIRKAAPGVISIDAKEVMTSRYPGTEDAVARHFLFGNDAKMGSGAMSHRLVWDMMYDDSSTTLWSFVDFRHDGMLGNTQGYVHGGCLGAVFDGALGTLFTVSGTAGFTARLEIDYRRPVEIPSVLLLRSTVDRVDGRKIYISGQLTDPLIEESSGVCSSEAKLYTEATALFLGMKE